MSRHKNTFHSDFLINFLFTTLFKLVASSFEKKSSWPLSAKKLTRFVGRQCLLKPLVSLYEDHYSWNYCNSISTIVILLWKKQKWLHWSPLHTIAALTRDTHKITGYTWRRCQYYSWCLFFSWLSCTTTPRQKQNKTKKNNISKETIGKLNIFSCYKKLDISCVLNVTAYELP